MKRISKKEMVYDIANVSLALIAVSMAVFIVWFKSMEFVNNV